MSAPANCPGCGTKLRPDWEACPNCPMSFLDAPPQKTAFQSDTFRSFGPPIILFGGLAYFLWAFSQYLWHTAETGAQTVAINPKLAVGIPGVRLPPVVPPGTLPSGGGPVQEPPAEPDAGRADPGGAFAVPPKRAEEDEGDGTISVMATQGPKAVNEWKMRGVIYDLVTLKPVPGVHMIFTDYATNSRAQIQTDARGLYRVILPPLPGRGYLVSLSKTGYHNAYLNPGTEGVADMPRARRQELGKELSTMISEPASLQPNSEAPLVTDFHIAPK